MKYILIGLLVVLTFTGNAQTPEPKPMPFLNFWIGNLKLGPPAGYNVDGSHINYLSHRRRSSIYIIDGVQIEEEGHFFDFLPAYQPDRLISNNVTLTRTDIRTTPTPNVNDMAAIIVRAYQPRKGAAIRVAGSKSADILYVVDGMHITRN